MHVTDAADRDRPADADIDLIDVTFAAPDRSIAAWVRVDLRRRAGATRFLAAVLRPGRPPAVVLDHDLPLVTGALEFRAPAVWVELCAETPLEHWTVGMEAFGLEVDPGPVTPRSFGTRIPIGLDLDLETTEAPQGDERAFELGVRVHGEVLLADAAIEVDAPGRRWRRTDGRRPRPDPAPSTVPELGRLEVCWPDEDGPPSSETRIWVGGARPGWAAVRR